MPKTIRVVTNEWQTIDGVLTAVFVGRDTMRREVRMAVPAGVIPTLASDARRRLLASETKGERPAKIGEWMQIRFLTCQTMNVGTTDEHKIAIIFDRNLETEFAMSIPVDHALELSRLLAEEAEKAPKGSPRIN
jgi:hypothetical protein